MEGASGAHREEKKSLSDALFYIAKTNKIDHERIKAINLCKIINQACGSSIGPWDLGGLDEEWVDVFLGLLDLPEMQKSYKAFEDRLAEIRQKHPTYRKYLN